MSSEETKEGAPGVSIEPTDKFAVLNIEGASGGDTKEGDSSVTTKQRSGSNVRAKASTGPRIDSKESNLIGGTSFVKRTSNPTWIKQREAVYEEIKARRLEELAKKNHGVEITVTLPDGKVLSETKDGIKFTAYKTTPYDVAVTISQGLADSAVLAKVIYGQGFVEDYSLEEDGMETVDTLMEDNEADDAPESEFIIKEETKEDSNTNKTPYLWDLNRPLVGTVTSIEFLKFDSSDEAKTVFWHSSAHMLGEALENLYGSRLTIGPPLKGGFYYDSYMDSLSEDDYKPVETEVAKITKQKQSFERMVVTKEEALKLFEGNPFKEQIISTKIPEGGRTTVYKCGTLIDLCRGPHVLHTGKVKAFSATRHSATQWLADTSNDSLQRMYGISFPDKKLLKIWLEQQKAAKERDHRKICQKQSLVMFHELSPGSAFFLPHGTRIYNTLVEFIRNFYHELGYTEIITPNMYNLELWHTSGHAQHYKDAMFCFDVESQEFALKPMNCPGHCLVFGSQIRSYRDLPIRMADFGVLHRNELSGALTGLTRVRRFQQDDAHIYCREDQIESEVFGALQFMKQVYDIFGMTYKLELSTRPKKALGDVELWRKAEKALANAMDRFLGSRDAWRVNPGDGAFYGPKIDIKVMDALERVHQCATIQLDFQLPIRFDLKYNTGATGPDEEKFARPVMVHRAMLGSVERMFAVLCEHYGGKWPLWLSPRQVMIIPVHAEFYDYAESIRAKLHALKFFVDVDLGKDTFQKKVRNAQIAQYNFQLVVGKQEATNQSVNVRTRENTVEGEISVNDFINKLVTMRQEYK